MTDLQPPKRRRTPHTMLPHRQAITTRRLIRSLHWMVVESGGHHGAHG